MTKDERPVWFVWCRGIGKPYPAIIYESLPSSHDGRRLIISEPRRLEGEDLYWPLDALAAKYPPPKEGNEK